MVEVSTAGPQIALFYSMSFYYNMHQMPYESHLYQLAYGKIGFVILTLFHLKLKNLLTRFSEDLL